MSNREATKTPTPRLRRDRHGREELTMADWALAPGPMPRKKVVDPQGESEKA